MLYAVWKKISSKAERAVYSSYVRSTILYGSKHSA